MMMREAASLTRRSFLKSSALLGGLSLDPAPAPPRERIEDQISLRDRIWLAGQEPGALDGKDYAPRGHSYISAVEAGAYLSVPNLIFEFCWLKPLDYQPRYLQQLAIPMRLFKQVVWSIVGCSGGTDQRYRDVVLKLAEETPNITGVFMDDFFQKNAHDPELGVLTVKDLQQLRRKLKGGKKKLDLWVVVYSTELDRPVRRHLALCDVVTLWVWKGDELQQLPGMLAQLEKLAPRARRMLGCYMFDYGARRPMPIPLMKLQCGLALEWIKQGRVDGMVFDGSNVCDFNFDSVEWTREWIRKVGDQK